jgi:serine/threonine-protein kinase
VAGSKYKLGDRLGGGGMAEVFRATLVGAEGFARPMAIKRVLPGYSSDQMFADMLKTEARIASLLTHPNIVSVFDFDRDDEDRLFLVMELVEGKNLAELIATGRPPLSIAAFVTAEVLRALAFAHALEHQGRPMFIVHRDVSPHNVLVAWSGAVKLSDFGIAKAAATTQVTKTGVVKGKSAYLSPEQAMCKDLDGRSDLFAAGIMLHEMLTGARLFGVKSGAQDAVIVHRVLTMPIVSPRAENPEVSEALAAVCLKLLERDRDVRFQTADQALEALLACPEMSKRGELEVAELLLARFPDQAPPPASWQAFAARTNSAQKRPPAPSKMEFGGFSKIDDEPAPPPRKGGTAPLSPPQEEPRDTQLMVSSDRTDRPDVTAILSGTLPAQRSGGPVKATAMYGLLGLCALAIMVLGWRVWIVYTRSGLTVLENSAMIEPPPELEVAEVPPRVATSTPSVEKAEPASPQPAKKAVAPAKKAPSSTDEVPPPPGLDVGDRVITPSF